MKATVNRKLFIEQISPIPSKNGVSILIADGILSVASFGQGATARIPAYVIEGGQVFLNFDEWNTLTSKIKTNCESYIDIDI